MDAAKDTCSAARIDASARDTTTIADAAGAAEGVGWQALATDLADDLADKMNIQ